MHCHNTTELCFCCLQLALVVVAVTQGSLKLCWISLMSARACSKLPSRAALLGADFSWSCNLSLSPQADSKWPFRCTTSSWWALESCCRVPWAVWAAASCSCSSLTSPICNTKGFFADAPAWKGHLPFLGHKLEALLSQDASSLEMCTTS